MTGVVFPGYVVRFVVRFADIKDHAAAAFFRN
jgi:hypothetical protein